MKEQSFNRASTAKTGIDLDQTFWTHDQRKKLKSQGNAGPKTVNRQRYNSSERNGKNNGLRLTGKQKTLAKEKYASYQLEQLKKVKEKMVLATYQQDEMYNFQEYLNFKERYMDMQRLLGDSKLAELEST